MKKYFNILLCIIFLNFGVFDLLYAKGSSSSGSSSSGSSSSGSSFSEGGGSRSSSSSFSGSSGYTAKSPSGTKYDNSARTAASHDSSKAKFDSSKSSNSPSSSHTTYSPAPRVEREASVYRSYKPTGYYTPPANTTVIYRDNYNSNFLQVATMMWMFHHWDTVDKSRFEESKLKELEAKVKQMEQQGVKRDINYTQPGVDSDLMYNKTENESVSNTVAWWIVLMVASGILISSLVYRYKFYKKRRKY